MLARSKGGPAASQSQPAAQATMEANESAEGKLQSAARGASYNVVLQLLLRYKSLPPHRLPPSLKFGAYALLTSVCSIGCNTISAAAGCRLATFGVNAMVVRKTSPAMLGVVNVR